MLTFLKKNCQKLVERSLPYCEKFRKNGPSTKFGKMVSKNRTGKKNQTSRKNDVTRASGAP